MNELEQALRSDDAHARAEARKRLLKDPEQALASLLGLLSEARSELRREAAQALGELGRGEAVEPLLEALSSEPYEVAAWVAGALAQLGDRRATAALLERLADEEMAHAAAAALGSLGDPAAVEPLKQALEPLELRIDYGSYLGRFWLAQALVQLGDRSQPTVEALREVIERDFGYELQQTWGGFRNAAVELLLETGDERSDEFLRAFLRRERETLQLRYHIARRYWLTGEREGRVRATVERMARHPLYPQQAEEARALLAQS